MKGKVFLAWSGTNVLATQVAVRLRQEGYDAIVGGAGQDQRGNQSGDFFVGATVLGQINQCYQAIFIVQKKSDGFISNNLMFELGYALGKISPTRIHMFYIDIDKKDPKIPSDLEGCWAEYYSSDNEALVEIIAGKFLENQRMIIPENKFMVMDAYFSEREKLRNYCETPTCSDYELAQYVLFFSQAAYIFDDLEQGEKTLRILGNTLARNAICRELSLAIQFGECYLRVFAKWKRTKDLLYLRRRDMDELVDDLNEQVETVSKWKNEDDFKNWFMVLLNNTINYAMMLGSNDPDISLDTQLDILRRSEKSARDCLRYCRKLLSLKDDRNAQCVHIYQAYMNRNLATMYQRLHGEQKQISQSLNKSFRERVELFDYCKLGDINTRLREYFETEYILAMAELMDFHRDQLKPEKFRAYRRKCRDHVEKIKETNKERAYYASKIMKHLQAVEGIQEDN